MNDNCTRLTNNIKQWAQELGFCLVGITRPYANLTQVGKNFHKWLDEGHQGEMEYLQRNLDKRCHPEKLMPGIKTIISCAIKYCSKDTPPNNCISRYALGRDYHKTTKKLLNKLAEKINNHLPDLNYRCFVDSAPVFEKHFAVNAGLGWQGKNCLVINPNQGSWFFLGTIYTNLTLNPDAPIKNYCGNCKRCLENCPTKAITAPYLIDAKRCIGYLTIEHKDSIPVELRPLIGTRIYGCDMCQLVCPWNNKKCSDTNNIFQPYKCLANQDLITLFSWSKQEFLTNLEGSAIRRIGHERWLRNIAIALGNTSKTPEVISALESHLDHPSTLVKEHVEWALIQQ